MRFFQSYVSIFYIIYCDPPALDIRDAEIGTRNQLLTNRTLFTERDPALNVGDGGKFPHRESVNEFFAIPLHAEKLGKNSAFILTNQLRHMIEMVARALRLRRKAVDLGNDAALFDQWRY
ncbi:hypothetical protein ASG52_25380 [Methylobacterium sp. Leaf456]|nr:hypothetical protein ASG52_25380 [Methylobacterium sp. Leaf456]